MSRKTSLFASLQNVTLERDLCCMEADQAKKALDQTSSNHFNRTVLHIACEQGKLEVVKCCLEFGAKPNKLSSPADLKKTPLHVLIQKHPKNTAEITQLLIAYGADPTLVDTQRQSAHDYANQQNDKQLIEILRKAESMQLIATKSAPKQAPYLHSDIEKKVEDCQDKIMELVNKFVLKRLTPFDHDNWSLINRAIFHSNFNLAAALVEYTLEIPTCKHPYNFSPLHLLAIYPCISLFQDTINKFPRLLCSRDADRNTPLHLACRNGGIDLVKVMLKSDKSIYIDLNAKNIRGYTALHYAAREGHTDIVELLLKIRLSNKHCLWDYKSRVTIVDSNNRTFLLKAILSDRVELVILLLTLYPELIRPIINCQDSEGRYFLQLAVAKGLHQALSLCLELEPKVTLTGFLTLQGYKSFVSTCPPALVESVQEEPQELEQSLLYSIPNHDDAALTSSIPSSYSKNLSINSLSSSQRGSYNTSGSLARSTGGSLESKGSHTQSQSLSHSISNSSLHEETSHTEHVGKVRVFDHSTQFSLQPSNYVTILTESLLHEDLAIFETIITYIISKKIPLINFPDFSIATCLAIQLQKWKALEMILRCIYNERIGYEVRWHKLFLTNTALSFVMPDITSFYFLTDPDMSFNDIVALLITNNELTEVPEFTLQMKQLKKLSLAHNKITKIPRALIANEELRELVMSGNPLENFQNLSQEVPVQLFRSKLHRLELDNCGLDVFPAVIEELGGLHHLNLSHNNIELIPSYIWMHRGLRLLNLSHNQLGHLTENESSRSVLVRLRPPRQVSTYYDKKVSRHRFQTLLISSDSVPVRSVQRTSFEHSIIPGLQLDMQQNSSGISELDLSFNEFDSFPTNMACLVSSLKKLNMSKNRLSDIFLPLIPSTLIELNLDGNDIHNISTDYPDRVVNCLTDGQRAPTPRPVAFVPCMHRQHDALNWLKTLSLDRNKIVTFPLLMSSKDTEDSLITNTGHNINQEQEEKRLRFPALENLSLEYNNLIFLTPHIQYQASIHEINLDGNPELEGLPFELGYLKCFKRLQHISVADCPKVGNIPPHIFNQGSINTSLLMPYFRAQLKGSVKSNLVKLMVIGTFNQGKTSLLRRLKGLSLTQRVPTEGVEIDSWKCDFGKGKTITFVTWDFAGQEEYYATHQCFLSTGALYILCFSLETFFDAAKSMQDIVEWLQSIELRAPRSPVLIVGTHLDKVPENKAMEIRDFLYNRFVERRNMSERIPDVIDVLLVSCVYDAHWFSKLKKKMDTLRDTILDVVGHLAMEYNLSRQCMTYVYKKNSEPKDPKLLLNQQTPTDYEKLREKLFRDSAALVSEGKPPILRDSELKATAEHIIDNPDDLFDAVEHLHMQGSILHFNTPLLKDVYFLDPNWLCKQMALVIGAHTETNKSNGLVSLNHLEETLKEMECSHFWNKFIRLLEQFQIMVRFSEETVLIPSQLPLEPESDVGVLRNFQKNLAPEKDKSYYVRIWPLEYVPHGFWPRLLCRVAQDPVIISLVSRKSNSATISLLGVKEDLCRTKSEVTLQRYDSDINWNLWRNGIQLLDKDGTIQFEVIQLSEDYPRMQDGDTVVETEDQLRFWVEKKFRILSIVHMERRLEEGLYHRARTLACQLFIRLAQHINSLFEAWFPGILNLNGEVPSFYPCPDCFLSDTKRAAPVVTDPNSSANFLRFKKTIWNCFREETLFDMFTKNEEVSCHWHAKVDISRLAPDVKLLDVGAERILDLSTLRIHQGKQLGAGSYGVVYKGEIWNEELKEDLPCAIKLFATNTMGMSYEHILDNISLVGQWSSYQELRKELSPMVHLKHRNLALLLGVTINPLQMIMGLARKGSLLNMINRYAAKETFFHPFVAAKSILQIASGLNYLHSHNLVHLDLKAANVLVWDFPEPDEQKKESLVHLKLADYGTVLHCDTLGVRMSSLVGTPGYIAPEVVLYSGKQSFTSKADVFSFAMVIYEILSYRPPFINFDNAHDQQWAPTQGRRPILQGKEKYSPCLFQDLMQACWAADPDNRPTMAECEVVANNPLFPHIRSIMTFENMVRFTSHAVITNDTTRSAIAGNIDVMEMEGEEENSIRRYSTMNAVPVPHRRRTQSEINFNNTLAAENTQIWLGAFNHPFANKVAIVQYLHGQMGNRVWYVDILPAASEANVTVLTSVYRQVWLGTSTGRLIVIDGNNFKKLPLEISILSTAAIHSIKHVQIWNMVFISCRSNEVMILRDQLEFDISGKFNFKVISFIDSQYPVYAFQLVQKSASSWEVWGTKDSCTIEVFPLLANGKLGQNFTKPLTMDPTVRYQRFNCIASCFKEEISEQSIDGYAVVWISEWQRSTAYVLGAVSRSLRAGVCIPKDPTDSDAIKEVSMNEYLIHLINHEL